MSIVKTKANHKTELRNISTRLTMTSLPETALLSGVIKLLQDHTAFEDTISELGEKIYHGDIFAQILSERDLFEEKLEASELVDIIYQLEALADVIITDYVLITKV